MGGREVDGRCGVACNLNMLWVGNKMRLHVLLLMFAVSLTAQVKIVPAPAGGYQMLRNGQPYYVKGAVGSAHLAELVAAGGNSIRAGVEDLDRAQQLGLTVLAGLPFGKQRAGFDYSDTARVEAQRRQIRQIVEKYRNHAALLAWAIGNELEIRTTPQTARRALERGQPGSEDGSRARSEPPGDYACRRRLPPHAG